MHLSDNTLLQGGKYKIVRFISSGGFGCTYEAELCMIHKRVAIKEFFVKNFCNRDSETSHISVATSGNQELVNKLKHKFIEEVAAIWQFSHPNIVRVTDVFEENGTAYYVMEYIDGMSLQELLRRDGAMSETKAKKYIRQVAEALQYVHSQNRLHLDIKPGNILVDANDNAILIDFGASKQYDDQGENTSTLLGLNTVGYAPVEQMSRSFTDFNPAADVYALGATFYRLLTNVTPPDAIMLMSGDEDLTPLPAGVSKCTREAIEKAMIPQRKKRTQSIAEFLQMLDNQVSTTESQPQSADEETVIDVRSTTQNADTKLNFKDCTIEVNGIAFDMVAVHGGTFIMGSKDPDAFIDEKVRHTVSLSNYYIGKTEVTQALWEAVMGYNPSYWQSNWKAESCPVESISWDECQKFIRELNRATGKTFRLPTEAEWEFAARGGIKSNGHKYSGSNNIDDVAFYDVNSVAGTHPVGNKKANELGIHDMSGNVREWCHDWYHFYNNGVQTNPFGPSSGKWRILRGGSWCDNARLCRSTNRGYDDPSNRSSHVGLRLVLVP